MLITASFIMSRFLCLSKKRSGVAANALPGSGHADDAQLLGGERSKDGGMQMAMFLKNVIMLRGALLINARRSFVR
jgi:hypothetical protein